MGRSMMLGRLKLAGRQSGAGAMKARLDNAFNLVEARTRRRSIFAGKEFTAADIMMGFSLTTMRYFMPYDYARLPNLGRISRGSAPPGLSAGHGKGRSGDGAAADLID